MAEEQQRLPGTSEEDPLLGSPGDASQQEGKPLYYNFFLGMSVRCIQRYELILTELYRYWYCRTGRSVDCKHIVLPSTATTIQLIRRDSSRQSYGAACSLMI